MTTTEQAKITAQAIGLVMRQLALTSEYSFKEIWSETAAGYETYGSKSLVWTYFVRSHNTAYWCKRVMNQIIKSRKAGTL